MVSLTLNSIPLRAVLRSCRISVRPRTLSDEDKMVRTDLPKLGPGDSTHGAIVDSVRVQARTEVLLTLGLRIFVSMHAVQTHGESVP